MRLNKYVLHFEESGSTTGDKSPWMLLRQLEAIDLISCIRWARVNRPDLTLVAIFDGPVGIEYTAGGIATFLDKPVWQREEAS